MSTKILIIDDDKESTDSFKQFLEGKGFSIDTAEDIQTGNELLEEFNPDLLILDVIINSKPLGLRLISKYKSIAENRAFPVIITTKEKMVLGMNLEEVFHNERFNPNVILLPKPVNNDILHCEIVKMLKLAI